MGTKIWRFRLMMFGQRRLSDRQHFHAWFSSIGLNPVNFKVLIDCNLRLQLRVQLKVHLRVQLMEDLSYSQLLRFEVQPVHVGGVCSVTL